MSVKSTNKPKTLRYATLETLPKAQPLSRKVKSMSDDVVALARRNDPDADEVPETFWRSTEIIEPEGTEQITLRLPRRVLKHFRATGKGYQSRISAVLQSYVDAMRKSG
jgi:uncharacterized protein (DUF4415 family)